MDEFKIDFDSVEFPDGMHVILSEEDYEKEFDGIKPEAINGAINAIVKDYRKFQPNLKAWHILDAEFEKLKGGLNLKDEALLAYKKAIAGILTAHVSGMLGELAALNFYMSLVNMKFQIGEDKHEPIYAPMAQAVGMFHVHQMTSMEAFIYLVAPRLVIDGLNKRAYFEWGDALDSEKAVEAVEEILRGLANNED